MWMRTSRKPELGSTRRWRVGFGGPPNPASPARPFAPADAARLRSAGTETGTEQGNPAGRRIRHAGRVRSPFQLRFPAAIWLAGLLASSATAAELVFNFGDMATNRPPPGFTNLLAGKGAPGRWQIVLDEVPSAFAPLTDKAPVPRRPVLAQTSMDVTDEHFPLLVYEPTVFDDFTLTTKFKLVEGLAEQMAGIVFRLQDEQNFYVIRASGLGNNVRFYKMVAGQRSAPIGPEVEVPKGVWHELTIECQGNKIRAAFNGREVLPWLTDTSFTAGRIGFWTKSDAVSRFADSRITYRPRESVAQAAVRDAISRNPRLRGLKIYRLDAQGAPRVIASKDAADAGAAGGASEQAAITAGQVSYGKGKDTVSVVQPLRDRNGNPIAAVRVTMNSFAGQTEQSALQRALPIVKSLQAQVQSAEDLGN
jgi:hypothetical protein